MLNKLGNEKSVMSGKAATKLDIVSATDRAQ
jgi:hypothetical protein